MVRRQPELKLGIHLAEQMLGMRRLQQPWGYNPPACLGS
jgi:hypothetical protein